jgi:hypothetical protein
MSRSIHTFARGGVDREGAKAAVALDAETMIGLAKLGRLQGGTHQLKHLRRAQHKHLPLATEPPCWAE